MARVKRERKKRWRRRRFAQAHLGDAPKEKPHSPASIRVITYDKEKFSEEKIEDVSKLSDYRKNRGNVWVDVVGMDDLTAIQQIGEIFEIHHLVLEDAINFEQRPKTEQFDDWVFILLNESGAAPEFTHRQILIAFTKECVITFREESAKCVDTVVERLRNKHGSAHQHGGDYLVYLLIDAVVDTFFPVLEHFGDQLEDLEDEIIYNPSRQTIADVHEVKRELLALRRQMWPTREVINSLLRDATEFFEQESIMHLRDVYDHAVQIIDFIETYRELGADLMDVYLSSISNRMNEVMKVLTIITTIFAPPTFIAGIYGMNFNPQASPYNMPELNWYFGYPCALLLMLLVAVSVTLLLWWKGFLSALGPVDARKKKV
ncbi:MAG TPA: magnesium/cobalt transporter CorA [Planktothrix sp.]|jgi:magnesium transporter